MKASHDVRSASVLGRRYLVAGALASLCGLSHGATTLSQFPPNPGVLPGGGFEFKSPGTTFGDPVPPRAWVNGTYGSVPGAKVTDALTLRGPAGPLAVNVARTVGLAEIGGAAARCLALANPVCLGAAAAYLAYQAFRVHPPGDLPGSAAVDSLSFDPGASQVSQNNYCGPGVVGGAICRSSRSATAAAYLAHFVAGQSPNYGTTQIDYQEPNSTTANVTFRFCYSGTNCSSPGYIGPLYINLSGTSMACPASIDASNPAYNIPEGLAPGADGKCQTARYNHVPITPALAAEKFAAYPPADPGAVADNALKGGESMQGQPAGVTGPSTQTGTPTTVTTTNPDASTTTTTTTPKYNYSYTGDTVFYEIQTTTVTNNAGAVTTTVTTTPAANPADPVDPCSANPQRVGCIALGTPVDGALPTSSVPITMTPQVFASGVCPAPAGFTAFGVSREFSFVPMCDAASTWVRGIVLVIAAAVAGFVFVGGLKS